MSNCQVYHLADVDSAGTTLVNWMRSEEKVHVELQRRKANKHEEEAKKKRAIEGYTPAFIIDVGGVPLEQVESKRRLAAATTVPTEQREECEGDHEFSNEC
jgi:5S rRNA maturation endonuclease (ribonuclease M5)